MDNNLNNNVDLNNNITSNWYEIRDDDQTSFPEGDLGHAYTSEEKIAAKIPNYKEYKWYQNPAIDGHPGTEYFYTLGEKLENKIESGEITPEQLPEGSDIQKEAEQLYDDNPSNDEVNNEVIENTDIEKIADEVIPKEEYDAMSIDEIEQRDAETLTEGKPYMAIAEDMGLNEDDLYYFEQPEFIESLTPEQVEDVKNEPDKQKKIELLKSYKSYYDGNNDAPEGLGISGGSVSVPDVSGNFQPYDEFVSGNPPMIGSFLGGTGNVGVGDIGGRRGRRGRRSSIAAGSGSIAAGSVSDYGFDDKGNNSASSEAGKGQTTDVEVEDLDANTASLNGANSVEHLDNSLDELGFKDTKHNKEIKSNEQADLPDGEFHEKDKEELELKLPEAPTNDDIISYLEKDSANWENGDSKAKYLPFRFFVKDGELWATVIGRGIIEKIQDFMKHEILANGKLSSIINQ